VISIVQAHADEFPDTAHTGTDATVRRENWQSGKRKVRNAGKCSGIKGGSGKISDYAGQITVGSILGE
jgi:hypothetical protein